MALNRNSLGHKSQTQSSPRLPPLERKKTPLLGEVLHIDNFGNVITNIHQKQIPTNASLKIKLKSATVQVDFAKTYGEAKLHEQVALIGSYGFLEVALNTGSAAEKYQVKVGDKVEVTVA